jgi:hypothetical protein
MAFKPVHVRELQEAAAAAAARRAVELGLDEEGLPTMCAFIVGRILRLGPHDLAGRTRLDRVITASVRAAQAGVTDRRDRAEEWREP